mmetsp:Transcript_112654/g.305868  ORF Transcript_112654/g.305868 Transcript_112654/m.305868 type:complete len:220 (+) Transcript_112654:446-1105(+)
MPGRVQHQPVEPETNLRPRGGRVCQGVPAGGPAREALRREADLQAPRTEGGEGAPEGDLQREGPALHLPERLHHPPVSVLPGPRLCLHGRGGRVRRHPGEGRRPRERLGPGPEEQRGALLPGGHHRRTGAPARAPHHTPGHQARQRLAVQDGLSEALRPGLRALRPGQGVYAVWHAGVHGSRVDRLPERALPRGGLVGRRGARVRAAGPQEAGPLVLLR